MKATSQRNRGYVGAVLLLIGSVGAMVKELSPSSRLPAVQVICFGLFSTFSTAAYFIALGTRNLKVARIAYRILFILWCVLWGGSFIVLLLFPSKIQFPERLLFAFLIAFFFFFLPFGFFIYLLSDGLTGLKRVIEEESKSVEVTGDKCRSCGRKIGESERAIVVDGELVCSECEQKLSPSENK